MIILELNELEFEHANVVLCKWDETPFTKEVQGWVLKSKDGLSRINKLFETEQEAIDYWKEQIQLQENKQKTVEAASPAEVHKLRKDLKRAVNRIKKLEDTLTDVNEQLGYNIDGTIHWHKANNYK